MSPKGRRLVYSAAQMTEVDVEVVASGYTLSYFAAYTHCLVGMLNKVGGIVDTAGKETDKDAVCAR